MKSRYSHDTPARISYTDGGTKTVTFPGVSRGDLKNLSVDGEQIMTTHDIAVLSRQIRLIAILAGSIALAVLVLVSLILYEVSGNIWVRDQWIVDPSWQQNADKLQSPSD